MIDLHTHSTASDGSLSPEALMREAAQAGISAIALTDHDSIKGLDYARNEAGRQGIRLIPGIEIEINYPGPGHFHLLGLGIRAPSPGFVEAVEGLSLLREERNLKILALMRDLGIEAGMEELRDLARGEARTSTGPGPSVGRPHFAALLVKRGMVKNQDLAFARYLGPGKPLYVPKPGLDFDRAQALVRESLGLPVLAHPLSLYLSWSRLRSFLAALKDRGLGGLEAWHPAAKVRDCRRLEGMARELGLRVTAGSDFHSGDQGGRRLGRSGGGRKIEDAVLEAIPELLD
ncbi:MAG: PHP domain-containing protein [Treponema sp.]|jgi:predicted metal-dependent phosphoesterase TrpH|nr:PHP domain-containing protein [Treponema sp.]